MRHLDANIKDPRLLDASKLQYVDAGRPEKGGLRRPAAMMGTDASNNSMMDAGRQKLGLKGRQMRNLPHPRPPNK